MTYACGVVASFHSSLGVVLENVTPCACPGVAVIRYWVWCDKGAWLSTWADVVCVTKARTAAVALD